MERGEKTQEITRLLHDWNGGSTEAREELWTLLYGELKKIARSSLRRSDHSRHHTTSLVHQAFLRLLGSDVEWQDRNHFFAVASRAMRFVLVDEARSQLTEKRRAESTAPPPPADDKDWLEVAAPNAFRPEEVLAVHDALAKLAELNPRHERLVELRYFAGFTVDETAEVLGVTPRTIVRDWKAARVWLHHRLETA
jgi:RNA polymerase sigma factor (TIGR02999 family)